ncbi:MAG: hypothetical protein C0407_06780 [Desulfobacca sp.]|nr:hypothetical protein [Desulfobacca sp.]
MGEIKSTLDLIMERTKNLSMSPEEKEEIKRQEWLKKVRGWVQKFLDDLVDRDKIKGELLEKEHPSGWENLLKKELIDGLDPDGDNQKRFELLKEFLEIDPEGFMKILGGYQQRLALEGGKRLTFLKGQLANQGVAGTAVIPNLNRDPSWKGFIDQEKQAVQKRWQALINN